MSITGSWTYPSNTSSASASSHDTSDYNGKGPLESLDIEPPQGEVTIVFTDITRYTLVYNGSFQ